jgi:hypothetical protein
MDFLSGFGRISAHQAVWNHNTPKMLRTASDRPQVAAEDKRKKDKADRVSFSKGLSARRGN